MRPPDDVPLFFAASDSVMLEGAMVLPSPITGVAVVCHPHPLFGGTMTNKVSHSLHKALRDGGLVSLRFNFRGVGRSQGEHGFGEAELADVTGAIDAVESKRVTAADSPVVLGGFSFGSHVGLRAARQDPRVTHRIGIGLPLGREYDFSFLDGDRRPLWLIAGAEDGFCEPGALHALGDRLRAGGVPVEVIIVPGANHFFDRFGHVLRQELDRIVALVLARTTPDTPHMVERRGQAL